MLETLFYPDEIRVQKAEDVPDVKVSDKELSMAYSLIDLMTEDFDPSAFKDNYREALAAIIEAKLQGGEIVEAPAAPKGKVVDLMAALKASVEAAQGRKQPDAAKPAARRKRAAAG
jgi:DNA end-binding protein Ku